MQVTILDTDSLSDIAFIRSGQRLAGVILPDTIAGSVLTFQGSVDGENFYDIYWNAPDDGAAEEFAPAFDADTLIMFPRHVFEGLTAIKVRTGTAASPSAQSGDVEIGIITT